MELLSPQTYHPCHLFNLQLITMILTRRLYMVKTRLTQQQWSFISASPSVQSPPPNVAADHSQRRRSYKAQGHVYEIQEFSAHGRRPAVTSLVGVNIDEWFKETSEIYTLAKNMDFVWKLLSVNQSEVNPHAPDDIHTIPVVPTVHLQESESGVGRTLAFPGASREPFLVRRTE